MTNPTEWGAHVRSFGMPHEPELIWYIQPEYARTSLGEQLGLLLESSKVMGTIAWINGGILLIVWATSNVNGIEEALKDIADYSGIPITTLAN